MNISVVIPTYNRGYIISRAIDSVLKQTYLPNEIIVVDDGSTDNTNEILKSYRSRINCIWQKNSGVSASRNTGIEKASGQWIALLDSDDEWLPEKLENNSKFSVQNKELHIFQSEELWIRKGVRVNPKKKHKKYGGYIFEKCLPLCIISPSAVIFKKSLWQEMNGFDEAFPVCEDYDLWLRIASRYPVGLDSKPGILKYGGHDDQLSGSFEVIDEYRVKALEKQLQNAELNKEQILQVILEAIKKTRIIINGAEKRINDTFLWKKKLQQFEKEYKEIANSQ